MASAALVQLKVWLEELEWAAGYVHGSRDAKGRGKENEGAVMAWGRQLSANAYVGAAEKTL
jgi:hypothetical protein